MDLARQFLDRSRHYLATEYRTKLRRAVEVMPADAVWWRPNDQANSVGNLLIHLAGNMRQWIVSGVGGAPGHRNRAAEFTAREGAAPDVLLADLDAAISDVDAVIARLCESDLARRLTVQGREVSVLEAIYHVVEHFSLHLGQIVYIAKLHAPGAVQFYEDAGGLAKPLWPAMVNRQTPG